MSDLFPKIEQAANSGAFGCNPKPLPSEASAKAGNYSKGRISVYGLAISIEQPRNSIRCGIGENGKPWQSMMRAHYGGILGVRGADGDLMDVFVGAWPESETVWVINQKNKAGGFDESKCMLCFESEESARNAYMHSYERGWRGLGSMVKCTLDQFKWWIKNGNHKRPLTAKDLPYDGSDDMEQTVWDSAAEPVGTDLAGVMYALRQDDTDGLLLDSVTVGDILEAADGEMALDALVVPMAKLERKMQQLQNIMGAAGESVSITAMQITPPFKQRGTTNVAVVFELSDGQTVTIYLHNPDTTPNKLAPTDEMISWKWMLNKKDVTIVVAPEKGEDLNPREVGRRIMKLAERNSARFAQANKNRAERLASIESLKTGVQAKEAELESLTKEIEVLTVRVEEKKAKKDAPLTPEEQAKMDEWNAKMEEDRKSQPSFNIGDTVRVKTYADRVGVVVAKGKPFYGFDGYVVEYDDKELGTLKPIKARTTYLSRDLELVTGAEGSSATATDPLPPGWTEATPGGMATNKDPETGGIIDKQIVDGKWFAVANKDGIGTLEGFATRADAFAALAAAVAKMAEPSIPVPRSAKEAGEQVAEGTAAALAGLAQSAGAMREVEEWAIGAALKGRDEFFDRFSAFRDKPMLQAYGESTGFNTEKVMGSMSQSQAIKALGEHIYKIALQKIAEPAWKSVDPKTPEGYAAVMAGGEEAMLHWQDVLGSFFQGRIVEVRNGLLERGWFYPEGTDGQPIKRNLAKGEKDGSTGLFDAKTKNVGAGANVAGVTYTVYNVGPVPFELTDDLTKTPAELAAAIDAAAQPAASGSDVALPVSETAIEYMIQDLFKGKGAKSAVNRFFKKFNGQTNPFLAGSGDAISWTKEQLDEALGRRVAEFAIDQAKKMKEGKGYFAIGATASFYSVEESYVRAKVSDFVGSDGANGILSSPEAEADPEDESTAAAATEKEPEIEAPADSGAEDPEQSAYTPFDWSQVKMPTAVQLGAKLRGASAKNAVNADGEGWTNGHLLDLGPMPTFFKKVLSELFPEKLPTIPGTSFERVIANAKSGANTLVEPVANYDAEFSDTSSTEAIKKGKKVPVNAFVLANKETGLAVNIDKRYFGYFAKTYKGAEFYAQDSESALLVKHQGKVVGVVMPLRGADANTLKRAMKAASADPQEGYAKAKAAVDAAYARSDAAEAVMKQFAKGAMGLTPDDVKATPEWQAAYAESNAALAEIQKANEFMLKNFPNEVRAERDAKRQAQEEALAAAPAAEQTKIERVSAAYTFASATDEFKEWLAEGVEDSAYPDQAYQLDQPYSPLASAAAMEEEAKKHGATIEWGFFGGTPA